MPTGLREGICNAWNLQMNEQTFPPESPVGFLEASTKSPGGDSREGAPYSLVYSPALDIVLGAWRQMSLYRVSRLSENSVDPCRTVLHGCNPGQRARLTERPRGHSTLLMASFGADARKCSFTYLFPALFRCRVFVIRLNADLCTD
jgi:hypothetical protein